MRLLMLWAAAGAVAFGTLMISSAPAVATKTKMGCDSATEVWDATLGKCQPGAPKYKRGSAQPPPEVKTAAVKKAPAKKAAVKKAKGPDAAK
jgi:hypothetical protein